LVECGNLVANLLRMGLTKELLARIGAITVIFMMVSLLVIQRHLSTPSKFTTDIPLLFVLYGIVMAINILFCLRKYQATGTK